MTTGIVYHRDYLLHEQYPTHPERKERLSYTIDQLTEEGIWVDPRFSILEPSPATLDDLLRVHDPEYLLFLREASDTGAIIDMDTFVPKGLFHTALLAAGGAIRAADAVLRGEVENAFALVRPPGHHAHSGSGSGFCYLNNIAIMVRHIQKEGKEKVMILDWDAHHGNGTQDIFYHDPSVLFTSVHQMPFYPGTGRIEESGAGEGSGYTVNMPVPAGTTDESYLYLFDDVIRPITEEFKPDFIAISAGQDNHFTDPLTGLALTAQGYSQLMTRAVELADEVCDGDMAAVLEGGYSVEGGLPYTNLGIIAAMARLDCSQIREPFSYLRSYQMAVDPAAHEIVMESTVALQNHHRRFWRCFR